tara:strand:+ start:861 stop:1469 length:609 start_codon:yes stop_codon:yes gene_type:complete
MPVLAKNRTKLVLKPGARGLYLNGSPLLSPLRPHGGIMFPIQPDVIYSQGVNYSPYDMAHTNYTYMAYRNTPSPDLQLTAQFASVTEDEARYTYSVIHFLRSVTKMFYGLGQKTPAAGTPPPVLEFSTFGDKQFSNIPVVVTTFSTTYDSNVDLKLFDGDTQIPVLMTIFIQLAVQINPDKQKRTFTTSNYISGSAYKQGFI